jgi:alkylation response protein AidB-like acyl-CoA dehydrogenase
MDFDLTEEQRMIKEAARKIMEQEVTPYLNSLPYEYVLKKEEVVKVLKMLRPLNYLGAMLPEDIGGGGLDFLSYALMMEELDYRVFLVVMLSGYAAGMVLAAGTEDQKKRLFKPLLDGEMIGCSAITEPNVGSNSGAIQTRAVLDGDQYIINGTKTWITNATYADVAMVTANEDPSRGSKGISLFFVEKAAAPFEARPIPIMIDGPFEHVGELIFDNCRVHKENKFGSSTGNTEGFKQILIGFQGARCLVGMQSLIIAQTAYNHAIRYAKERMQFGRPIGQFQLIQGMIAEMKSLIDASRLLIYRGAFLVQKGVRCALETSLAKYFATEAAIKVASMALQIHGAYGLSKEYPVEHLFKYARVMTIPDGTTEIQKLVVAREALGGMSAFV